MGNPPSLGPKRAGGSGPCRNTFRELGALASSRGRVQKWERPTQEGEAAASDGNRQSQPKWQRWQAAPIPGDGKPAQRPSSRGSGAGRGGPRPLGRPWKRACRGGRLRAVRNAPRKRATSCGKRTKCTIRKRAIQRRALCKNERCTERGNAEARETRGTNPSKSFPGVGVQRAPGRKGGGVPQRPHAWAAGAPASPAVRREVAPAEAGPPHSAVKPRDNQVAVPAPAVAAHAHQPPGSQQRPSSRPQVPIG